MSLECIEVRDAVPSRIKDLYHHSFPLYERRPWPQQVLLVEEKKLQLLELVLDNRFAGFIFFWPLSAFIFIEHFAIDHTRRGSGIGTQAMQHVAAVSGTVILETEPEDQGMHAQRRIRFYEKLGYKKFPFPYQQPPYLPGYPAPNMYLMHNGQPTGAADFEKVKNEIYTTVYGIDKG